MNVGMMGMRLEMSFETRFWSGGRSNFLSFLSDVSLIEFLYRAAAVLSTVESESEPSEAKSEPFQTPQNAHFRAFWGLYRAFLVKSEGLGSQKREGLTASGAVLRSFEPVYRGFRLESDGSWGFFKLTGGLKEGLLSRKEGFFGLHTGKVSVQTRYFSGFRRCLGLLSKRLTGVQAGKDEFPMDMYAPLPAQKAEKRGPHRESECSKRLGAPYPYNIGMAPVGA